MRSPDVFLSHRPRLVYIHIPAFADGRDLVNWEGQTEEWGLGTNKNLWG